jgi:hypothetical protein
MVNVVRAFQANRTSHARHAAKSSRACRVVVRAQAVKVSDCIMIPMHESLIVCPLTAIADIVTPEELSTSMTSMPVCCTEADKISAERRTPIASTQHLQFWLL